MCGASLVHQCSGDPEGFCFCRLPENNTATQQTTDRLGWEVGHKNQIKHEVYFQNKTLLSLLLVVFHCATTVIKYKPRSEEIIGYQSTSN